MKIYAGHLLGHTLQNRLVIIFKTTQLEIVISNANLRFIQMVVVQIQPIFSLLSQNLYVYVYVTTPA